LVSIGVFGGDGVFLLSLFAFEEQEAKKNKQTAKVKTALITNLIDKLSRLNKCENQKLYLRILIMF